MSQTESNDRCKLLATTILAKKWGILTEYRIQYRRSDNNIQVLIRESYERGDTVAVLPCCENENNVILTRQLRPYGLVSSVDGMYSVEVPSGRIDGRELEDVGRAEVNEETGCRIGRMEFIGAVFLNPAVSLDKAHLFLGWYPGPYSGDIGKGLKEEGEDIEAFELSFADAAQLLDTGVIVDAKTIVLLRHLALLWKLQ